MVFGRNDNLTDIPCQFCCRDFLIILLMFVTASADFKPIWQGAAAGGPFSAILCTRWPYSAIFKRSAALLNCLITLIICTDGFPIVNSYSVNFEHNTPFLSNSEYPPCEKCTLFIPFSPATFSF